MTSHFYAIADAGGNIYPGTFSKDALSAQCTHIAGGRREFNIPCKQVGDEWHISDGSWLAFAERGDHVVYCTVETNETVKVTVTKP